MKRIHFGSGIAVFVLLFGIALLDAVTEFNVLRILFWLVMGCIFLLTDNMRGSSQH